MNYIDVGFTIFEKISGGIPVEVAKVANRFYLNQTMESRKKRFPNRERFFVSSKYFFPREIDPEIKRFKSYINGVPVIDTSLIRKKKHDQ